MKKNKFTSKHSINKNDLKNYIMKKKSTHMKKMISGCLLIGISLCVNNANAQWTQTSGTAGLNVMSLTSNGSRIFAGTNSGIYYSANSGAAWGAVNNGVAGNENVWAMSNDGSNYFAGTETGAYISSDFGANWTGINTGMNNVHVKAISSYGTRVYAATYGGGGVFISTDDGSNWSAMNSGINNKFMYSNFAFSGSSIFIGAQGSGIYRSTDIGLNWVEVNTGLPANVSVHAIVVLGTKIFAGTESNGVYVSSDNGDHWTAANNGLTNNYIIGMYAIGNTVFAASPIAGLFMSTDNGANWTAINTGLTNLQAYCFTVSGTDIFVGFWGAGVWKRPLSELTTGINEMQSKVFSVFPNPGKDKFYFQSNNGRTIESIDVYTIAGERILSKQNVSEIDLSNAPKGIYFAKINDGRSLMVEKIVLE